LPRSIIQTIVFTKGGLDNYIVMGKDIGSEESERIMTSLVKKYQEAGSPDAYWRSVADQKRKTLRYLTQRNKVVSPNNIPIVSDLIARVKAEANIRSRENKIGNVANAYGELIKSSDHSNTIISGLKKRANKLNK
ncbi:MAG: hypothetical protein AAB492_02625, partial [Patescibacteria group bacterium]